RPHWRRNPLPPFQLSPPGRHAPLLPQRPPGRFHPHHQPHRLQTSRHHSLDHPPLRSPRTARQHAHLPPTRNWRREGRRRGLDTLLQRRQLIRLNLITVGQRIGLIE